MDSFNGESSLGAWDDEQISMFKNAVEPILQFYKAKHDTHAPEDELKTIVKRIVALSGVTRPPTPALNASARPKSATSKKKDDKDKNDKDKNLRFLGECCVCALEKRGNYDRLGFLCAGCRTVPLKNIQTATSTRVPRVRYSPHYVPCVMYPRRFDFLPEFDAVAAADISPATSCSYSPGSTNNNNNNNIIPPKNPLAPSDEQNSTAAAVAADVFGVDGAIPGRYTVYAMDVPEGKAEEMFAAADPLRQLYHPSFLYNFSLARDVQRNKIWVVHETAQPIVLRGALLSGHRCYELLRQVSVAALSGLLFLKDFGRSHNDLRPHNFFIDDQHRVKLRLAPFPTQDLPAPFSYENSFFSENEEMQKHSFAKNLSNASFIPTETVEYEDRPQIVVLPGGEHPSEGTTSGTGQSPALSKGASPSTSQFSLQPHAPNRNESNLHHSFASKIDSYCISRQGTVRRRKAAEQNHDSRDMFVLGVTLTLIAYGDVNRLPLPNDDEVGEDPDELFLVEFIWRLLTGERNPDEALRDDYLTTVRQVDGCAVETIVLRVCGPELPADVREVLARHEADDTGIAAPKKKKEGEKKLKFNENNRGEEDGDGDDNNSRAKSEGSKDNSNESAGAKKKGEGENNKPAETAAMARRKQVIQAALDSASVRFRVNRWTTAAAKLVSFFSNAEVPAGESENQAADPRLFQIIRTPTQLTFYSVRRDPRLLRARQIASERQVSSFNNALMASSSMSLAGTAGKMASATFSP